MFARRLSMHRVFPSWIHRKSWRLESLAETMDNDEQRWTKQIAASSLRDSETYKSSTCNKGWASHGRMFICLCFIVRFKISAVSQIWFSVPIIVLARRPRWVVFLWITKRLPCWGVWGPRRPCKCSSRRGWVYILSMWLVVKAPPNFHA